MYHHSKRLKIYFFVAVVILFGQLGTNNILADTLGEHHTFFVNPTFDATERTSIQATLEYVGTHAYFYVDDSYLNGLNSYERAIFNQQVISTAQEFDNNI